MDGAQDSKAEPEVAAASAWRARLRAEAPLYAAIAAGSIIGSVLRWLVSLAAPLLLGANFPWGTLIENVSGSFAIGLIAGLTGPDGRLFVGPLTRQFLMTGLCGGYTTFSMFSFEMLGFLHAAEWGLAALYVSVSILTWMGAVWAGDALARRHNRLDPNVRARGLSKEKDMQIPKDAQLLRIYLGESKQYQGKPLHEAIVLKAREMHIAGATVLRGGLGFGHSSRLHTAKILRLSDDLPLVIEIVDSQDKITALLKEVSPMMAARGLVTLEKVQVLQYGPNGNA